MKHTVIFIAALTATSVAFATQPKTKHKPPQVINNTSIHNPSSAAARALALGVNKNSNSNSNANTNANVNKNNISVSNTSTNNNVNNSTSTSTSSIGTIAPNQSTSQAIGDIKNITTFDAPASTAYAPALTASMGTCMGSSSVGGQGASFGISFGSTWHDSRCDARLEANQLYGMGYKVAAAYRMCQLEEVAKAMKAAGTPCPDDRSANDQSMAAQPLIGNVDNVYYN